MSSKPHKGAKPVQKLQQQLSELRYAHSGCWVCGSTSNRKTSREGYAIRCRSCFESGKSNPDVDQYEALLSELKRRLGGV